MPKTDKERRMSAASAQPPEVGVEPAPAEAADVDPVVTEDAEPAVKPVRRSKSPRPRDAADDEDAE